MEHFGTTVALVGIVIIVASLLSGALERSGLPLVAVFLALGAILGSPGLGLVAMGFDSPALRVLATLGLALVLFSDAVSLDLADLQKRKRLVWRVLGPGTVVPAIIVASAAHWLLGLSWPAATILGAALASTDPVLLRSVLRSPACANTFPAHDRFNFAPRCGRGAGIRLRHHQGARTATRHVGVRR
ncbi:MAG: cation:proton antiporter, partial [Gemmatimonadaceae bacterium]|nr:cation:proton antiporter [Gemmatimonadaceae bacterium]